jgi:hypothetical protein
MKMKRSKKQPKEFSALAKVYFDFYSDPSKVKYPLNYKVDMSLKQRFANRALVFVLDRSVVGSVPILHGRNGDIQAISSQPVHNVLKTMLYDPFEFIEGGNPVTARARRVKRSVMKQFDIAGKWHYLSEDECRRIITRIVNKLNRRLFKGRACRVRDAERISVVACMHDKRTRRHFHLLFGVPPHITESDFKAILNAVLKTEPFVYRQRKIGRIRNLANAIGYNVEPSKSQMGNPVIFDAWQQPQRKESEINGTDTLKQDDSDNLTTIAA